MADRQHDLTPEQLAAQAKAGCREAFEQLLDLFQGRIYAFLCRLVGNPHDAQDLTQDTFLKAYRGLSRFEPRYSFASWLYTIAKRTAADFYRANARRSDSAVPEEVDVNDPAVLSQQRETTDGIWALARKLKPSQYEALWLRYGENFEIADIARVMNTSEVYVKVLLHRGRQHLIKLRQLKHNQF